MDNNLYSKNFFSRTIRIEQPSAAAVAGILFRHFSPRSVIDVGCGVGIYLKEFEKLGVEIFGLDGAAEAVKNSLVGDKISLFDLREPLELKRRFDLCLCIEAAEHLEKQYSERLIDSLSSLAPVIFFTAATPGQAPLSYGHVNEQRHSFWIKLFAARDFIYDPILSREIQLAMKKEKVVWWVVKNLMIFKKDEAKTTN
jgi:2-polyprenyl-3-methyl-5-hydroxy-6-metoxy-1,4-benzoquinol methylase